MNRSRVAIWLMLCAGAWLGCGGIALHLAMPFLYREAEIPRENALLDIPYRLGSGADPEKHRLDFFLPVVSESASGAVSGASGWPVLVFVHGGGWTSGDRTQAFAGGDIYRNIGRYFASQGVGTAVISYRLQPAVDWRDQVEDVATAVWWVHERVADLGGDPNAIFLAGHSSGAQLAAHVALGTPALRARAIDPPPLCGLVPVSGSAFDLTADLGRWHGYFEERFRAGDPSEAWMREASPASHATPEAPPTLILYSQLEAPLLRRQAKSLNEALRRQGVPSRIVVVPGQDHLRIVLALSRPDRHAGPEILSFIKSSRCEQHYAFR
ncbi:MAG: alpha/beta hydrolase [Proteobacteria bacterium]|nr:alpha/beta hydrolase [Pseudomonadota bacterium]